MSSSEYAALEPAMISELADALVESGSVSHASALDAARRMQTASLPDRERTKDQWLLSAETEDDAVVGAAWFGRLERDDGDVAYLYYLAVPEAVRGRGFGAAALIALEDEVRAAGLDRVQLYVLERNARAKRLYERRGYVRLRGDDAGEVMEKRLGGT